MWQAKTSKDKDKAVITKLQSTASPLPFLLNESNKTENGYYEMQVHL